jgi:LemA protein
MKRHWLWLPLLALAAGCGYNRIQELDERTNQMRGNIDSELMRRNDLIPNLVATVDASAKFEQQTQTRIAEARSGLTQAREQLAQAIQTKAPTGEVSQANAAVSDQLRNFINVSVEAYPDLKSNANFIRLQDELTETENRLAVSRRDYNEAVNQYNTYIRRFPQTITAKVTGAGRKDPFAAPASATTAPKVQFPSNAK